MSGNNICWNSLRRFSGHHHTSVLIHHGISVYNNNALFTVGRPVVVLSMDGQRVVASDSTSAAVLTCSDITGVPTPLFNWTYANNPYRIITSMICML